MASGAVMVTAGSSAMVTVALVPSAVKMAVSEPSISPPKMGVRVRVVEA